MSGWQHSTPKAFVDRHGETFHGGSSVDLVESQRQHMTSVDVQSPAPDVADFKLEWKVFATDNHLKASDSSSIFT